MRICFKFGNFEHCYDIPVIELAIPFHIPSPGLVNYPAFLHDATVLAAVNAAIRKISDPGVQATLFAGVNSAVQVLQKRGGAHVGSVSLK
jgi:hypothetical protein